MNFYLYLNKGWKNLILIFKFHFISGKYETDNYAGGNKKLYKGYMLPILEYMSKKQGSLTISNSTLEKLK